VALCAVIYAGGRITAGTAESRSADAPVFATGLSPPAVPVPQLDIAPKEEPQAGLQPRDEVSLSAAPEMNAGSLRSSQASTSLAAAPRFLLRDYRIEGNTVLDSAAIRAVISPHIGLTISVNELEDIRRALTRLYIDRGYINSGFVIPDQDVASGIVIFRSVEGRVTDVDVRGAEWFDPDVIANRLRRGLGTPFNINELQTEQQILLQDPLIRKLNLELQPGLEPGQARLQAGLSEASPYSLNFQIANNQSPTVGEVRGQVQGAVANLLGRGDVLAAQYGRSQGLNDGTVSYTLPLDSDDTRLTVRYEINGTVVVTPVLNPLNITSRYDSISVGLSRPFYRTPEAALTLGALVDRRQAQTFLLGMPFSFTPGSDSGKTNVTALRFYQDWADHDAEHALGLHSTFSLGIDALGATVTGPPPNGRFFSWLGQGQYVRRVYDDWDLALRSDLQLANHALFPIEQFALGGIDTVRGYREYLTVTDDAFFASGELRIPVAKVRIPALADSDEAGTVQVVPFYDYGRGWNIARPTPYPSDISSIGAGLRWTVGSGMLVELYYGKALRNVRAGTSLQDRGIDFRVTVVAF
jgi:hemolysin activation/secretion protein